MSQYKVDLHFSMRFRGATKGSQRLSIKAVDWCPFPKNFENLIACCTREKVRVFGNNGKRWKMLLNRRPSREREALALRWSVNNVLAIACGCSLDGTSGSIILLQYHDGRFRKTNRLDAPGGGSVSSLSWDSTGQYLLGVVEKDEIHSEGYMMVVKTGSRPTIKKINCGYTTPFTAKFDPSRSHILSTSTSSTEIIIWVQDTGAMNSTFNWIKLTTVTCPMGINSMSISPDGYIATIQGPRSGGKLVLYSYSHETDEGSPCAPWIEEIMVESDGGTNRTVGATLKEHCRKVVSCDWSSTSILLTGSASGSMCFHTLPDLLSRDRDDSFMQFAVVYLRYNHVHALNMNGPVTCVAWCPGTNPMLASAGQDGVVVVWNLIDSQESNSHDRNYLKERNYFAPDHKYLPSDNPVHIYDVESVSSISVSESEDNFSLDGELAVSESESNEGSAALDIGDEESADTQKLLRRLKRVEDRFDSFTAVLKELYNGTERTTKVLDDLTKQLVKEAEALTDEVKLTKDVLVHELEDVDKGVKDVLSGQADDAKVELRKQISELKRGLSSIELKVEGVQRKQLEIDDRITLKQNQLEENVMKKTTETLSKVGQLESYVGSRLSQLESQCAELEVNLSSKMNQLDEGSRQRHKQQEHSIDSLSQLCGKILSAVENLE